MDGMIFTKDFSHLLLIPEGKEGAVTIPGSTTHVSAQALSLCQSGSSLTTGDGSTAFASHDRMLFSKDLKTLVACPPAYGTAVVLPTETESIGEYALAGCKDLASITVLGNINSIDSTAFADEVKASAVIALPAGSDYEDRKSIWENAGFQHFAEPAQPGTTTNPDTSAATSGLTYTLIDDYTLAVSWQGKDDPEAELEIPSSAEINGVPYRVSTMAENAFANRGSLTSVKLPTTITTISNAAFAGCANLTTIELPNTLRTIGERAFEATSLKDAWLPASINSIGSRAFASCSSLERVVALGAPEVASDILAGCTNVSIYVPSGSEDTWNPGLPSDNNHLMPYGIMLSEEPLAIEAGQEANLLEGGNLQTPDPVEASFSYAATPLSVDAGQVSAKKAGATDVTTVLSLDGTELTRASRTVEVSPSPEGKDDATQLNYEVPVPGVYLSQARDIQISVDAPFAATFGLDKPYDVKNPPTSMEASAKFINNTDIPVQLAKVTCTSQNFSNVLAANSGAPGLMYQALFSLYPEGVSDDKAVDFGYDGSVNNVAPKDPSVFTIPSKDSSSYIFRLNLANAKVNSGIADAGITTQNLATVMCTFKAMPLGIGVGNDSSSFYLKDKNTNQMYTATQVKAHANAIAQGDENIKAIYQAFMTNENTYECKTVWKNTSYDVRIIGINHDKKADNTKAGLTFQFVNLLNTTYKTNSKVRIVNNGGWGASELRARMNPGTDNPPYGTDDNEIWNMVPKDLQDSITTVKKDFNTTWDCTDATKVTTSSDKLFLLSYYELAGSIATSANLWIRSQPWLIKEGTQYAYYRNMTVNNDGKNDCLKKEQQVNATGSTPSTGVIWWNRSVHPYSNNDFMAVSEDGYPNFNKRADNLHGVCPCFCF